MDDVETLEWSDLHATAYYLVLIAQEEFAKGFLLALVVRGTIPWHPLLLRVARDHRCKQLVCVVMEYLEPDADEFRDRCDAVIHRHELPQMPAKVADAMNILRHEKIGRWLDSHWVWADDPEYDADALAVAEGAQDRQKQDALYVRLATDGGIASTPSHVAEEKLTGEQERAKRFARLTESVLVGDPVPGLDYDQIEECFQLLFASMASDQDASN